MVDRTVLLRQLELLESLNDEVVKGPYYFCGMITLKNMVAEARSLVIQGNPQALYTLGRIATQLQLLVNREQAFLLDILYIVWGASLRGIR